MNLGGELVVKMIQSLPNWQTNVIQDVGKGPYRLVMDVNNELLVHNSNSEVTWRSNTIIEHPLSETGFVKMENNGKLTIYRGDGKPLWKSGTKEGKNIYFLVFKIQTTH